MHLLFTLTENQKEYLLPGKTGKKEYIYPAQIQQTYYNVLNKYILLSDNDRKQLRQQCRIGIIIPLMLLVILNIAILGFTSMTDFNYNSPIIQMAVLLTVLLVLFIGYLMNRRYLADLKNGEKVGVVKKIQFKEAKKDFEAGSGTMYIGDEMNEFIRYDLIVENTRYRIDKELYEASEKGGEVVFYFAPKSNYLLEICRRNR